MQYHIKDFPEVD